MESLVSIIIPIYNVEKYLNRCIESALNQSYNNLELILVNDGSTDNSLDICQQYSRKDSRVRVFSKENGGVSSARNLGLKMAMGNFIMFIDGDDWISQNTLDILLDNLKSYQSDIAICEFSYSQVDFHNKPKNLDVLVMEKDTLIKKVLRREYSSICAKIYKKSILEGVFFKEGINNNEDVLFLYDAFMNVDRATHNFSAKNYHINREPRKSLSSLKNINQINNQLHILFELEKRVQNENFDLDLLICRALTYYNCCSDYLTARLSDNMVWKKCYKGFRKNYTKIIFKNIMDNKTKLKFLMLFISPRLFYMIKLKYSKKTCFTD